MDSDDDIPLASIAKPKKKIKLKVKTPKIEDDDDEDGGMKPSSVKKERSAVTPLVKKKRKREPEPDSAQSSSVKKKKTTATVSTKELKKLEKADRLQHAMQSFLWWNAKEPPEGCQWVTMEHAGVSFPEPYKPHGVKLLYDGKPIDLTPVQEEA
jgi:DNA topoisomerase-1